jgi:hypothetical protein
MEKSLRERIEIVTSTAGASEPTLPLFDSGQPDFAERLDEFLSGFGEH